MYRSKRSGTACAGLITLCLSLPLWAADPLPYGAEIVRSGGNWSEGWPGEQFTAAPLHSEMLRSESSRAELSDAGPGQWDRAVRELEIAQGPYSDELVEPLFALGRHFRQRGDYPQARAYYRRALHLVRVNEGLYSARQGPVLRELLDTYREAGQLEALDSRYDYLFRLYGAGQAPYSELRVAAALEYQRWQREALRRGLSGNEDRRLLALLEQGDELFDRLLEAQVPYAWLWRAAESQLKNLYLLQDRVKPALQERDLVYYKPLAIGGEPATGEGGFADRHLQVWQRRAVGDGIRLMRSLLARAAGEPAPAEARARLALADWQQWNGGYYGAAEEYRQVQRLLRAAGDDRTLQEWLGSPRELPDNGVFWQPPAVGEQGKSTLLRARFDVSREGRVRQLEVHALEGDQPSALRRLRQGLRKLRFRPRFVGEAPESVTGLVVDYRVTD